MLSTTKFKSRGIFEVSRLHVGTCVEGYGHEFQYTKCSWDVEQVYLYHQVGLTSQNSDLCIYNLDWNFVSRLTRGNHGVEGYGHEFQYTKSSWYVEQVYLYHQVGLTSQNSDLCILNMDWNFKIGIRDPDQRLEWYKHVVLWFWHMLSMIHYGVTLCYPPPYPPYGESHSKSLQANTWEPLCWGIWPRVCILSHHGM